MTAGVNLATLPSNRATALAIGSLHFYSGIPCRRLAVDHCHSTNKIRGLLCFDCNTGIGKLGDDPQLIARAAEYVRNKGELNCQQE